MYRLQSQFLKLFKIYCCQIVTRYSILFLGLDNKLNDPEELFDLPARYCCSYVGARMDRSLIGNVDNYQQYEEVPHEPFIGSGKK